jgi:hypothetical protein
VITRSHALHPPSRCSRRAASASVSGSIVNLTAEAKQDSGADLIDASRRGGNRFRRTSVLRGRSSLCPGTVPPTSGAEEGAR